MKQTPESNLKRSKALKGIPKTLETRAVMHASKLHNRGTTEWQNAYLLRLAELHRRQDLLDSLSA